MSLTNKKIGIKDIARIAGVSIGTVDRVLHNRGQVAQTTRNMILKLIEDLNYKPNFIGRSLSSKTTSIAAVVPDYINNPYWGLPMHGILQAISEIERFNFKVSLHTFDYSSEKSFTQKATQALSTKPQGLVFVPLFEKPSQQVIHTCHQQKIPYVLFDVMINDAHPLAYFGQNSIQSGKVAGRLMHLLTNTKTDNSILVLKPLIHNAPSFHFELREKGFYEYFTIHQLNYHFTSMIIDVTTNTFNDNEFDNLFNSNQIDGIFVPNSRVHFIAEWLHQKKISNIVLIGYDLTEQNKIWLENEMINFLICQKPEEQGYKSIITLFDYLAFNKHANTINYCPIDIVCKENLSYYN